MKHIIDLAQDEQDLRSMMRAFPKVEHIYQATLQSTGDSSQEIRQRIMNYATEPRSDALQELPEILQPYIQKVVEASHKVTDHDISHLINNGYTEDFVFEITIVASVGAGLRRFRMD